jgi:flavin reductase (DIM6/NTAB) family NADH-FMN oxidoreductase RutF
VAHIECNVRDRVTIGDHDLFVATPMRVTADDEAFNVNWLVETDAGRVLHHLGADRYAALGKAYQGVLPSGDEES